MCGDVESDNEAAKSALRGAIDGHPRDPRVDISQRNRTEPSYTVYTEEEYNMVFNLDDDMDTSD